MGNLRIEPKQKPKMDPEQYKEFLELLRQGEQAFADYEVFYDLDSEDNARSTKDGFLYVARQEKITLKVRHLRKQGCLKLQFVRGRESSSTGGTRMNSDEAKKRILAVLNAADKPLSKSEILENAEIAPTVWNARIRDLVSEGAVKREGSRRDAVYSST